LSSAKPYNISKLEVYEAWKLVKANSGAGGVDGETIESFEANLKNNLYKIWNRMSSGCYFPPPVRGVEIPKPNGKMRLLGIPTIADRVAQTVVRFATRETPRAYFSLGLICVSKRKICS
jgi:retron-type reverse transcriptase